MKNYNTTQLNPDKAFERHVFHRDQFAHYLRWSHVLHISKIGDKILDFGCGSGSLYEVFYRNRLNPDYTGLDIRKKTIDKAQEKFPKAKFFTEDLVNMSNSYGNDFDLICSFEVIEHVGKSNADKFMKNIKTHCNENTLVLLSTPCFDEKVGAADNHTYDSGDGQGVVPQELTYNEMKSLIEDNGFQLVEHFGTFASQRDYKEHLTPAQKEVYEQLKNYYDSNLVANIMAPMVPEYSRNVIWKFKLK